MSEPQLERSVLESKDRDELFAIAGALGTNPPSRARKADLVATILEAAGIVEGGEEEDAEKAGGEAPPGTGSRAAAGGNGATKLGAGENEAARNGAVRNGAARNGAARNGAARNGAARNGAARNGAPGNETDRKVSDRQGGESQDQAGAPESEQALPARAPRRSAQEPEAALSDSLVAEGHATQRQDGESGQRRNRRRRGRDRGERELQGLQSSEASFSGEPKTVEGYLDVRDEGYGFLRTTGFVAGPSDVYVSINQIRRLALRKGDYLGGASRPASGNEKYPALIRVDTINGRDVEEAGGRRRFEELTPLFPDEKLKLELPGDPANITARIVDLISPIGKGQRGMIVSPPKAGKTTVLKQVAHSIEANNPDVHLMILLVDERPEEVTDMRRSVKGEVIASTFDRPAEEHTQVSELAIERAKRLVEDGRDVVIVLDGITRLSRAYNLAQPASGRIMSGGIDTGALYPPKKFFGAARNIEEGGSLTILATALVETGSRMDEVIFEEFKGTGNMELRLDRKLAERRIYPAIDVNGSSTRHEELLFDKAHLQEVWKLRRVLNALAAEGSAAPGLELLMERIRATSSNDEFLAEVAKNPSPSI